ncbi:MAG: peptide chain release factor N(5)-glutamine methyltransferase [Chloroflexi bacterium]|nr:peptide chain release factor N(5)-glutamine methyltransferase [Chloroflexota bacterium]
MSHAVETRRNLKSALQAATSALATIEDAESARLEAEVLLCHELRLTRAQLYARLEAAFTEQQEQAYTMLIERRLGHEPVAYITRHKEFFGLDFYVNPRTLIPRPETELLVEKVLSWTDEHRTPPGGWRIADIGTGSGAIAISLALRLPQATVTAIDASYEALLVARENCERYGVHGRVSLAQADLVTSISTVCHIVVANLPYVTRTELLALSPDIRGYEPLMALDGGDDGLDLYRRLVAEVAGILATPGLLAVEIGASQGEAMLNLARHAFPEAVIELTPDYAGLDRMVTVSSE